MPEAEKRKKCESWLDAFSDTVAAVREDGGKTWVLCVRDREANFYELFDDPRNSPRVGLLIRAKHDRVLGKALPRLFETLGGTDGTFQVRQEESTSNAPEASGAA